MLFKFTFLGVPIVAQQDWQSLQQQDAGLIPGPKFIPWPSTVG